MSSQPRGFTVPDAPTQRLLVARLEETTLKPDTPVLCCNRGRKPLQVTFDGNHLVLPVGYFITEYGAALHMQKALIVPGTRNLEVGGFVSWISILGKEDGTYGVDPESTHEPFTDEELQAFGESIEGLARDGRGELVAVSTSFARSRSRNQGGSLKPLIGADEQASPFAAEAAANVFDKNETSDAHVAEAEAAAEREPASVAPAGRPKRR